MNLVVISQHLRLDKGTETKDIATIHAFLRSKHGDTNTPEDTVHYGPSTSNKVMNKATCWKAFFLSQTI